LIDTIRLIGYNPCSLNEGVGLREVCYIAECTHKCPGCQNEKYWHEEGDLYKISLNKAEVLKYIDVIVDGRFEISERDVTLKFRGSSSQRIIDVKESLRENNVKEFKL